MPRDCNPHGDIFGGWILSMMDLAGSTLARQIAGNTVVTVAIDQMSFHLPVYVGDHLECFVEEVRRGRTSITIRVEALVQRRDSGQEHRVTEGLFTYVSIDENRRPTPISA